MWCGLDNTQGPGGPRALSNTMLSAINKARINHKHPKYTLC
jgi:hypothetical protein